MKKILFAAAMLLIFAVTLAVSVYYSSADNISNIRNGFDNLEYAADEVVLYNWNGSGKSFISDEDPQIIIENINCFVHSVRLSGSVSTSDGNVKIYYTTEEGEEFSEEKSLTAPYSIRGGSVYIFVDRIASRIRLDIGEGSGSEMLFKGIEINDRSLYFSINSIAAICVLPTVLAGILIFFIVKRNAIIPYAVTMKKYIPLLKNLISRDLKVKYRRSALGFLWSILNPLLMALVINIVFSKLFRFQVQYFATYYLTGALIFNFVVECTTASMTSVIGAAPLIKKVYIPKYVFPLQKCAFAFINMLFSSVAVVAVMLIQGVPFHMTALLFFVPMLFAFVFAYGMGLMLAAFTVFFRDIEHLYGVWVSIWMYLTPIIYPEELLVSNGLSMIMKFNPMYYFVHSLRSVVMYGALPTMSDLVMCAAFALIFLTAGLGIFKKLQDRFILYI